MPYLRLLGGVSLEQDNEVLEGRAAQKRRLAILALLAAAPGRTMGRERITDLIWPEKDEDRGRRLLSTAVYEIRKQLGEEVLLTRGDELALPADALPSDIDDFDAALEAGEVERALEICRGEFLEDFVLRGSVEFEQWLDRMRGHFNSRRCRALEQLARHRESAGDPLGAVDAWRRVAAIDRYNGRVALALVRALDAAGNAGGALQFAQVHETLLREDLGTEPDPELTRAVASIRDRPSARVPAAADPDRPHRALPEGTTEDAPETPEPRGPSRPPPGPRSRPGTADRRTGWRPKWLRRVLRSPRWRTTLMVTALLGLSVGLIAQQLWDLRAGGGGGVALAVLPLDTQDPADAAWADGLTEQLIETLSMVPGVKVSVRSAAFALRGAGSAEALRRLDANVALAGIVRRDRESVSIQLELSGRDGKVAWSQSYTYSAAEVDRIGTWRDIAADVQAQLAAELGFVARLAIGPLAGANSLPADRGGWTDDPLADGLYHQGREAWFSRAPDGFFRARRYYSEALERDSTFARAWAGLADVYNLIGSYDYGIVHPDSAYPTAREAARQAIRLAPQLHEAWAAMAHVLFVYDRDWEAADSAYQTALRLNPRFAQGHHRYSLFLVAAGRTDEALREAQRAFELDSLSAVMTAAVARHRYFTRNYPAALMGFEKARRIDPGYFHPHLGAGLTLLALDRPREASDVLQQALDLVGGAHPLSLAFLHVALARAGDTTAAPRALRILSGLREQGVYVPYEYDATLHIARGSLEDALDALDAAYENRSSVMAYLNVHPIADPLRGHPRFQALVERVGLPTPADHE